MKIPPSNPLTAKPDPEPNRAAMKRGQASNDAARAEDAGEIVEGTGAPERDFASVFDEVVSRSERREEEAHDEGGRRVSRETERAEHDGTARRREEREGGSNQTGTDGRGGGFEHRAAALREVSAVCDTSSARAILHVADLERIVSAVRAQLVEGGRRVVTIELRRSVLEGLKVKLTADGGGRVTAEFVAASERVRTQIDARAGELAELLRGRGVNLAALRTGVETGAGAAGGEGGGPGEEPSQTVGQTRAASNVTQTNEPPEEVDGGDANTYRA
ncbi:MAG: flagellar hook-length control protein FliK [Acidobacteria bacterium]|nr:flagellar hook-length control protein FliK [Acidobacteriota bacterium]